MFLKTIFNSWRKTCTCFQIHLCLYRKKVLPTIAFLVAAAPVSGNEVDEVMICLNTKFGIKAFRGQQEDIIRATLSGHDCLVVMATGEGKSLCYQLPAALSDGVTVVVSPLKSLMFEQSLKMSKIGVRLHFFLLFFMFI